MVDQYLTVVKARKRKGRTSSSTTLNERLEDARRRARTATGSEAALAIQAIRDLEAKLRRPRSEYTPDIDNIEAAFVKVAKQYSNHHRVTYGNYSPSSQYDVACFQWNAHHS